MPALMSRCPVDKSTLAVRAPAVIATRRTIATLANSLAYPTPITYAEPRALARKASDEFAVPSVESIIDWRTA